MDRIKNLSALALITIFSLTFSVLLSAYEATRLTDTTNVFGISATDQKLVFTEGNQTISIYENNTKTIILDNTSAAPDGGIFNFFVDPQIAGDGSIIFSASVDFNARKGLFRYQNGVTTTLIDDTVQAPDVLAFFDLPIGSGIRRWALDDDYVVFAPFLRDQNGLGLNRRDIYGLDLSTGVVTSIITDSSTTSNFSSITLSQGVIAYQRPNANSTISYVLHHIASDMTIVLFGSGDQLPDQPLGCALFTLGSIFYKEGVYTVHTAANGPACSNSGTQLLLTNFGEEPVTFDGLLQPSVETKAIELTGQPLSFKSVSISNNRLAVLYNDPIESFSVAIYTDDIDTVNVIASEATGVADDSGNIVKMNDSNAAQLLFQSFFDTKLYFPGILNDVAGVIEIDFDPSSDSVNVPVPMWALLALMFSVIATFTYRNRRIS